MDIERMELIRNFCKVDKKPEPKYILNNDDVDLILKQVFTDRDEAEKLLIKYNGDCVKVILEILNIIV